MKGLRTFCNTSILADTVFRESMKLPGMTRIKARTQVILTFEHMAEEARGKEKLRWFAAISTELEKLKLEVPETESETEMKEDVLAAYQA